MPLRSIARYSVLGLGVAAAALVGCDSGPTTAGVSGAVKYKGEPVKAGAITFQDASGAAAGGAPIQDGRYEIPPKPGIRPGTYKVAINHPDPKAPPPKEEAPGDSSTYIAKDVFPAQYNTNIELKADVAAGQNTINFDDLK